jgi:hypothetical protein
MENRDATGSKGSRNEKQNMAWDLVRRGNNVIEVPQRKYLNNKEFLLIFTGDSKSKAKRIAGKQRIRGYHTRVIEMSSTVWTVYRQNKSEVIPRHKDPTEKFEL